jgi:Rrf2 family protein
MLNLTRRVDYAMVAIGHLCIIRGDLVSAREIAARYTLPPGLLSNVLKDLSRAGLARSVRGTKGGYQLAMEPAEITARTVFEALQGPLQIAKCTGEVGGEASCQTWSCCPVKHAVGQMQERIWAVLDDINFADIVQQGKAPALCGLKQEETIR